MHKPITHVLLINKTLFYEREGIEYIQPDVINDECNLVSIQQTYSLSNHCMTVTLKTRSILFGKVIYM